jgi:3-methylcrotonyl-CoA carboxylase alpha subunit
VVAHYRTGGYLLELPGGRTQVSGEAAEDEAIEVNLGGERRHARVVRETGALTVFTTGTTHRLEFAMPVAVDEEDPSGRLVSPLPGSVAQVLVGSGQSVTRGQALMIIEAMKMEHTISAPQTGKVGQIYFAAGEQVAEGAQLLEFEAAPRELT